MAVTKIPAHTSSTRLSVSNMPLNIFPGPLHAHWCDTARGKGFDALARVRDRYHIALRCQVCKGIHVSRHYVVMTAQPLCPHCMDSRWRAAAKAAGLVWLGRDPDHRHYCRYLLTCGHQALRQFAYIDRVARGEVDIRCGVCLAEREAAEAAEHGWTRLGPDPNGNPGYRLYRHQTCGHEQRIAVANVRWGQCDCAGCGQSWTAKSSYIYLLDIRHPASGRHVLKLGYSSRPTKRHRHQLGLPRDAAVEVLRVVAMPTGHQACACEKAAHAALRREYPDAVVPHPEYADILNVTSEIYRPGFLAVLNDTLDRIEAAVASGIATRTPGPQQTGSQFAPVPNPDPDTLPPPKPSSITRRTAAVPSGNRRRMNPRGHRRKTR